MNLQNETFGVQIKDKNFINYLTKFILINYNVRNNENVFPAPQPVSIEKKDFNIIKGLPCISYFCLLNIYSICLTIILHLTFKLLYEK